MACYNRKFTTGQSLYTSCCLYFTCIWRCLEMHVNSGIPILRMAFRLWKTLKYICTVCLNHWDFDYDLMSYVYLFDLPPLSMHRKYMCTVLNGNLYSPSGCIVRSSFNNLHNQLVPGYSRILVHTNYLY